MSDDYKEVVLTRLREEYDADLNQGVAVTEYRTETNRYEVPCGACGRSLYVDEDLKEDLERAIKHDLDNQLLCSQCELEEEERRGFPDRE